MSHLFVSNLAFASLFLLTACDRKPAAVTTDVPWNASITYGTMTDSRDELVYKTVRIGKQTWLAQNLNFAGAGNAEAGVWNNRNADSGAKYGRLYRWSDAMGLDKSTTTTTWGGSDLKHQGVCPVGWHLPSDKDWSLLTDTILAPSKAGRDLKSSTGWFPNGTGSGNGSDASGFRALPGGNLAAAFEVTGENAAFWSATEGFADYAWFRIIYNGSSLVHRFCSSKTYGFSVRCLQN